MWAFWVFPETTANCWVFLTSQPTLLLLAHLLTAGPNLGSASAASAPNVAFSRSSTCVSSYH